MADNDAQLAEQARIQRDGEQESGNVKVKAIAPVSIAGSFHDAGSTFTASEDAVNQALARGLVERVKR